MGYAIRFEEVSKRYRGGGPRYASVRYDLADRVRRVGTRLRGGRSRPRGILALDQVSFEVAEGESFAIIGPNGAGKTTALKIVSRITYPTEGSVRVRGRVAALIEVGSGVHPELTARENIWLYGQILGMSKEEVRRRFDAIVEFAELGHVLDIPLKMYSSGMQMRLGFAIASHLNPDVFLVDESLAVGDAGFAAKCMDRMRKLVRGGKTLILVSHYMPAIEATCSRGIVLQDGRIDFAGHTPDLVSRYFQLWDRRPEDDDKHLLEEKTWRSGSQTERDVAVLRLDVRSSAQDGLCYPGEPLEMLITCRARRLLRHPVVEVAVRDSGARALLFLSSNEDRSAPRFIAAGDFVIRVCLSYMPIVPGRYDVTLSILDRDSALSGRDCFDGRVSSLCVSSPSWNSASVTNLLRASALTYTPYTIKIRASE